MSHGMRPTRRCILSTLAMAAGMLPDQGDLYSHGVLHWFLAQVNGWIIAVWSWAIMAQAATFQLPWEGAAPNRGIPARRIRPELAAAFTKSVYDALLQQEVSSRRSLYGNQSVAEESIVHGMVVFMSLANNFYRA